MVKETKSRDATPESYVAILCKTSSNEGDCNKKTCRGITTIRPIRSNNRSDSRSKEPPSSEHPHYHPSKDTEDKCHSMEPNINLNVAGSPISRHPRSPPENSSSVTEVDESLENLLEKMCIKETESSDNLLLSNVVITVEDSQNKPSGEDLEKNSKDNESDTNDELSTQEIGSTPQLLDPEVPPDYLCSSQSTPETLGQVIDERAAGEASEQQRRQKFLDVKRSCSLTNPPAAATDVLTGSAVTNNTQNHRRMLGERPGFTELDLGLRDLTRHHTFRRRHRLFTNDDEHRVTTSRSLDGEWLLSDYPNPLVPPFELHAQESAFPTFYDKIERPVPLPPWDDPSFAAEERPPTTPAPPPMPTPTKVPSKQPPRLTRSAEN